MAATLDSLHGKRRIVVYAARDARDAELLRQQEMLANWLGGIDRDVTAVRIAGASVLGVDDRAADLRRRYRLPDDRFAVVLIGKDGHVALSSTVPLSSVELEAAIDAMPMRRAGER